MLFIKLNSNKTKIVIFLQNVFKFVLNYIRFVFHIFKKSSIPILVTECISLSGERFTRVRILDSPNGLTQSNFLLQIVLPYHSNFNCFSNFSHSTQSTYPFFFGIPKLLSSIYKLANTFGLSVHSFCVGFSFIPYSGIPFF